MEGSAGFILGPDDPDAGQEDREQIGSDPVCEAGNGCSVSGCLAYALARIRRETLITLDADFLATDLPVVLHPDRER